MKNVTVITRIYLKPDNEQKVAAWFERWKGFLSKVAQCKDLEVITATDKCFFWIENWKSKEQYEKFVAEHLIYASYVNEITFMCYQYERDIYKKIG